MSDVIKTFLAAVLIVFVPNAGFSATEPSPAETVSKGDCDWIVRYRTMSQALHDLSRAHRNIDRLDMTELTYLGTIGTQERYNATIAIYAEGELIKTVSANVKISFQMARGYKVCLHESVALDP